MDDLSSFGVSNVDFIDAQLETLERIKQNLSSRMAEIDHKIGILREEREKYADKKS